MTEEEYKNMLLKESDDISDAEVTEAISFFTSTKIKESILPVHHSLPLCSLILAKAKVSGASIPTQPLIICHPKC